MAKQSIFPESMLGTSFSIENVISRLSHFQEQIHLLHWVTRSYAEHQALGVLYTCIFEFKDCVVEKLMGYLNVRPKSFTIAPLNDRADVNQVVNELGRFADDLETWAKLNGYADIEGMAQTLSGQAAKTKYLLTLT